MIGGLFVRLHLGSFMRDWRDVDDFIEACLGSMKMEVFYNTPLS